MEGDYNFRKNKDAVFLKRETPSSVFNSKVITLVDNESLTFLDGQSS